MPLEPPFVRRAPLAPLMAGGAICFLGLALLVVTGAANEADSAMLRQVFRLRGDALTPTIIRISALGNGMTVAVLAVSIAAALAAVRLHRPAAFMLVTTGGAMLLHPVLKWLLARPRPDDTDWLVTASSLAFPSGHAVNATATYLAVALIVFSLERRRAVAIPVSASMLLIVLLVAFSRTYLGVHYPLDVLGGIALGLLWMCLCARSLLPAGGDVNLARPRGTH